MNLLIDTLPNSVVIDGLAYPINTDFRIGILFEQLMQDTEVDEVQKLDLAIRLYFKNTVKNKEEAVKQILWFYRCGKAKQETRNTGNNSTKYEPIYDFDYDSEYIFSAFYEQYNIDLQDIANLHWWKFKALFKGLNKDTKIVEIMGYRSIVINGKMTKEQQEYYRKMKRIYKLPSNKTEREKEQQIANVFASMF